MKSTKLLIADHEIIAQALRILVVMSRDIERGFEVNAADIRNLLTFLREFADGCHHVKEEAIFFPALIQAGLPAQQGPLRVMNDEHERGRALIAAMRTSLSTGRSEDFVDYSRQYIALLSEHIQKENHVLFDMAEQILNDDEDDAVVDAFEHFERNGVGSALRKAWQESVGTLAAKYLAATSVVS